MTEEETAIKEATDALINKACIDEQYRQIQVMSYKSGYYAALSQMIGRLMQMQSEAVKTPYDV